MTIRTAIPPNRIGTPRVDFKANDFETLIWDKGYDVLVYKGVRCPCNKGREGALSTCQNCLGLGWVFINPLHTKAIITSINKNTKYKYWSPELTGTVAVTLRNSERLSNMDKIVLSDRTSVYSELLQEMEESGGQKFVFTSYPISSIEEVFLFNNTDSKLKKVSDSEYSISGGNPYVLKLNILEYPENFNDIVSVRYKHNIQYNVVDLPHDVRFSIELDPNGKNQPLELPIQAIAQKSEFLTGDSVKYDGTGILDNSY